MWSHPTWVRGLKHFPCFIPFQFYLSHPTWVRGLKHGGARHRGTPLQSHPTWVRGLKQQWLTDKTMLDVAPHVGAWIETFVSGQDTS